MILSIFKKASQFLRFTSRPQFDFIRLKSSKPVFPCIVVLGFIPHFLMHSCFLDYSSRLKTNHKNLSHSTHSYFCWRRSLASVNQQPHGSDHIAAIRQTSVLFPSSFVTRIYSTSPLHLRMSERGTRASGKAALEAAGEITKIAAVEP